jgi:hypothetical protein
VRHEYQRVQYCSYLVKQIFVSETPSVVVTDIFAGDSNANYASDNMILSRTINGPNKLECYITVVWKVSPGTNNQAYWTRS